ncbi:hypothetical protein WBG99_28650 [Streptomyces sp. TG1A-60]|uniref:hypothetical protein n=1 Tax=Streptomyces sp. TG1A-60 TaxID=3129111 RepID=UPI0030CB7994
MSDSVPEAGKPVEELVPDSAEAGPASGAVPQPEPAVVEPEYDPAAPAPLYVPRTATGHPDVDAALGRLADADHLATDGHVAVYEDVHRGLRDALTALDARPGPPAPTRLPTATPRRDPSGRPYRPPHESRS